MAERAVSSATWDILRRMLYSPNTIVQGEAVSILAYLIDHHGWQCVPNLTDADIMHLWPIVLSMMDQAPQGPSIGGLSVETVIGTLTDVFTRCASPRVREWMWDRLMDYSEQSPKTKEDPYIAAVSRAVRCAFPLWMIPNGMTMLTHTIRHAPLRGRERMQFVYDAVTLWTSRSSDPAHPQQMSILLTDVLIPEMPKSLSNLSPQAAERWWLWIRAVEQIIRIEPDLFTKVPRVANTMFAACTTGHTVVVRAALDVLRTVAPYEHPRFRSTMEAVIRQTQNANVRKRAIALLFESLHRTRDDDGMSRLIMSACRVLIDHDQESLDYFRAVDIVQEAMQRIECLPVMREALRVLRDNPSLSHEVMEWLVTIPYVPELTEEMIGFAEALLKTDRADYGAAILSRAWGRGYDDQIVRIASSIRHPDRQIRSLLPGLYSPSYAVSVVQRMRSLDPKQAAWNILRGVADGNVMNRPIPHAIVPDIQQAWDELDRHSAFPSSVLDPLWETEPQVAATMLARIMTRGPVRSDTAKLVIEGLCRGIGSGNPTTILYLWEHLVRQSTVQVLQQAAGYLAQQPDVWHRGVSFVPLAMAQTLYLRSEKKSLLDPTVPPIIASIVASLGYGWGTGVDTKILGLLDTVMSYVMTYPRYDVLAHPEPIHEMVRVLRSGWGRGFDDAIATRLLRVMEWMDQRNPSWGSTPMGLSVLLAMTDGGGQPTRASADEPYTVPSTVLTFARTMLERMVSRIHP